MAKLFDGRALDWLLLLANDTCQHSTAVRVALGIADDLNRRERDRSGSMKGLAKKIGVPLRSVERHMPELERDGWIEKVRPGNGKPNTYRLTVPDLDPPYTADQILYPDPPSAADQDSLSDPPPSADHNPNPDPPNVADPLEALTKGPKHKGGAALPATAHPAPAVSGSDGARAQLPPTPALPAARGATGGRLDSYDAPICTMPLDLPAADRETRWRAGDLIDFMEYSDRAAEDNPDLTRQDYSPPDLSDGEAEAIVRAYHSSAHLMEDTEKIRSMTGLGEPDLDIADLPVVVEVARMVSDLDIDDLAEAAMNVHRRAWKAYQVTLALAALVERAEQIAGLTRDDLFEGDEVPF
jgi:hypothetical protein